MATVNIVNITVLDNPTRFTSPFQFEITFECTQELKDDLEWKVVYVGNAEDSSCDQVLEEVMVGPVDVGINRFVLQTVAPNPNLINPNELIGVTVILICCSYLDQKFVQIGYYVNNEYAEEIDPENIPHPLDINKIFRNILADQPRVTRYAIDWSGNTQGSISVLPQDSPLDGLNEQEQEPTDDLVDLDNEVDDDEEEDEEDDDDDDAEVDLEAEDDEVSVDEYDEHGNYHHGMEIMPEDSNSMDVERMVQQ